MSLIRTVRMTFREEEISTFLNVFEKNKHRIRAFKGCLHLELQRDLDDSRVLATYSIWTGPEALESYRQSELFKQVWKETKALFAAKPVAFSHAIIDRVE